MEVEQKYSEIRRPVYLKRGDIIKTIPDFWLTAVRRLLCAIQMFLFIGSVYGCM
jgi:hypothetical protein